MRANFVRALETLLDGDCYAAIATHDEWLVEESLRLLRERALPQDRYEFQCCLGSDRSSATGSSPAGKAPDLVPYGRQWFEYSLRRLQEIPRSPATWQAIWDARCFATLAGQEAAATGSDSTTSSSTTVARRREQDRPALDDAVQHRTRPSSTRKIIEMTRPRRPTIIRMTRDRVDVEPSASP